VVGAEKGMAPYNLISFHEIKENINPSERLAQLDWASHN
jgi:hypothetical protein